MIIKDQEILKSDQPTRNGRIYPSAVVREIRDGLMERIKSGMTLMGEMGQSSSPTIDMSKVTHTITEVRLVDGVLYADVNVLGTPSGRVLADMIEKKEPIAFRTRGAGKIDKDGTVSDYTLWSIDAVYEPENNKVNVIA